MILQERTSGHLDIRRRGQLFKEVENNQPVPIKRLPFLAGKKRTYSGLGRALPHSSWMNLRIPVAFVNAGHSPD